MFKWKLIDLLTGNQSHTRAILGYIYVYNLCMKLYECVLMVYIT